MYEFIEMREEKESLGEQHTTLNASLSEVVSFFFHFFPFLSHTFSFTSRELEKKEQIERKGQCFPEYIVREVSKRERRTWRLL